MLSLSLLQKLTIIVPLVGTILHYAEGDFCNQKVFYNGCNRAMGFQLLAKKKERERMKQRVLNFMEQETLYNLQ